jgi:hypothetical protein
LEDSFKKHIDFERHVCEQLLEISRLIYVEEDPAKAWPTATDVMKRKENESADNVMKEIQANIDLLRLSVKYLNFDVSVLKREAKGNGKDHKGR